MTRPMWQSLCQLRRELQSKDWTLEGCQMRQKCLGSHTTAYSVTGWRLTHKQHDLGYPSLLQSLASMPWEDCDLISKAEVDTKNSWRLSIHLTPQSAERNQTAPAVEGRYWMGRDKRELSGKFLEKYLNRFVLHGFIHLPEPIKLYISDLCVLLNLNYITVFRKEKDYKHTHNAIAWQLMRMGKWKRWTFPSVTVDVKQSHVFTQLVGSELVETL